MSFQDQFSRAQNIEKSIQRIYNLNSQDDLPFVSPIVSGVSNSPSVTCIPNPNGSGRWCGSGYTDYFPAIFCATLREEEGGGGGDGDEEGGPTQEEGPREERIEIIENTFRWGYDAQ